jgi:2-polyprenyl-3-methyl-5-hydroxy-6-metoxy-1,4-benzoquinol methylase
MWESQAEMNRPGFLTLVPEWFAAMPDVHDRLSAGGVRVADIGCGGAWSSIGIARAYPEVTVDAFDLDAPTVEMARRNIAEADLADRVTVRREDIGMVEIDQPYALVTAFECLHDMPYPVAALRAMRKLADPDGVVLIADMKVPERFEPPGDLVERLMYGFSLTVCLPDSMSSEGSSATGTVMREPILRDYADRAGFTGVTTLDVDHEIWRFYRLQP